MTALLLSLFVAPAQAEFDPDITSPNFTVFKITDHNNQSETLGLVVVTGPKAPGVWADDKMYWFWSEGSATNIEQVCQQGNLSQQTWPDGGKALNIKTNHRTSSTLGHNCTPANASQIMSRDILEDWGDYEQGNAALGSPYQLQLNSSSCPGTQYTVQYKAGSSGVGTNNNSAGLACYSRDTDKEFALFSVLPADSSGSQVPAPWLNQNSNGTYSLLLEQVQQGAWNSRNSFVLVPGGTWNNLYGANTKVKGVSSWDQSQ